MSQESLKLLMKTLTGRHVFTRVYPQRGLKGGNLAQSYLGMPWRYFSRRVRSALDVWWLDQSGLLVQTCTTALPWRSRVPAEIEGIVTGGSPSGAHGFKLEK